MTYEPNETNMECESMNLGEKITLLRKQRGCSQEDLAAQLCISRQSVSKWESGASQPDLDRIVAISQLFGVSTDYLLTAQTQEISSSDFEQSAAHKTVTREEAVSYLAQTKKSAPAMAVAVAALVFSPIPLILLGGLSDYKNAMSDNMAGGLGIVILLLIAAAAVTVLIRHGMCLERYTYLEKEEFLLQSGLDPMLRDARDSFAPRFRTCICVGVVLCITGIIPLFLAAAFQADDFTYILCVALLLLFVCVAV